MPSRAPSGLDSGKYRATKVALTTATCCEPAVSAAVKARPRSTRVPTVSKKFVLTRFHDEPSGLSSLYGRPLIAMLLDQLLPSIGPYSPYATRSTPGI